MCFTFLSTVRTKKTRNSLLSRRMANASTNDRIYEEKNIKHYNGSMYGCARLTANKYMINREKMQPTLLSRLQMKIQSKVIDLHIAQYFHFFYFFTAIYQPLKEIHFRMSSSFVERWLFFVPLSHEFERLWFLYIHIHDTLYYATITPFIQVYNMCV